MRQDTREQLLEEIDPAIPIVTRCVVIGSCEYELVQPADPDSMLDDQTLLEGHRQSAWQPYWAQAWDAAFGMAEELAERELAGQSILDLGCGLGVTGAVAAATGADVLLADNAKPALPFARYNTWPWRANATVISLDWRVDRLDNRFDLIVGADILYDREEIPYLDRFWRNHLAESGMVLLGDPNRAMTRDLLRRLNELGWLQSESTRNSAGLRNPTRIVEMRLNSNC